MPVPHILGVSHHSPECAQRVALRTAGGLAHSRLASTSMDGTQGRIQLPDLGLFLCAALDAQDGAG